jgi:RAC serine/threonine-protein kinase
MTPQNVQQPETGEASIEFSVVIAASAPVDDSGLVHAVTVIQPAQTWTVIRGQDDFLAVAQNLSSHIMNLPEFPQAAKQFQAPNAADDLLPIVTARTHLQHWLETILMYPGARDSNAIRNFLTYAPNMIPPQYENVSWTIFTADGHVATPVPAVEGNQPDYEEGNLDDMVMDEMFETGDDVGPIQHDDYDSDDDEEYRASIRYKACEDEITAEDEMDLANVIAGEVEMVDDVGSLAQSLGASHLGRSHMLQEETIGIDIRGEEKHEQQGIPQAGLQLGNPLSGASSGGIGSAMKHAPSQQIGSSFNQVKPDSPPRLDAFKLIKVIGKGSFGKVFLVREIKTSQMFALKVLKKDNIIKRNQVEHTKTERSVLGYVKHPFIVGLNMAFQSREKLYFVLDYCAGGELFFHLGKLGKFKESRSRFYAAEIILAISYVHTLDIIYRDLKPENVLLDGTGHIRLTDFGLSKEGISSSSSGANSFCGTPEYLAPEILNRQGHGRGVDWWSLGALLYEMLTGLPPFYCQDRERLFEKIRKSELHYPASLSTNAKHVLRGLLTKDPTRRLGSGEKDAEEIKPHPFFASIDWEKLQRGEIAPPWAPTITGNQDTSQFDAEFTSMPIFSPRSMQCTFGTTPIGDNPFEGFTFQDRKFQGSVASS